jgi:predicted RNase H-like HicB family nuclease
MPIAIAGVIGTQRCISQGKTKEEATANIKLAIEAYITVLEEDNLLNNNNGGNS